MYSKRIRRTFAGVPITSAIAAPALFVYPPIMKKIFVLVSLVWLAGCSSDKPNVSLEAPEEFDKPLNVTGSDKTEKYGIKDSTVKVQKIVYLEEELGKTQNEITELENKIYGAARTNPGGLFLELQMCRKRLADQRIGGNGVPEPMEKWQKVSQKDPDYNYHVDKRNSVVAVTEEDLATKIDNLNKLKRVLTDKYDDMSGKLDTCRDQYHAALVNHGLDPRDTEAQGEWVVGDNGYKVWKMKKPATYDPEELMRRKQQREKKAE